MNKKKFNNIPVVILAGGFGTRLSEETTIRPKPMIEIGGMPMIWHIMKYYYSYGFKDFYILLGYKGDVIKNFFLNYHRSFGDINIHKSKSITINSKLEDWSLNLIETGLNTQTGGRIKKAINYLKSETFALTYGDGLSNVDLNKLYLSHLNSKKLATITAVAPPSRFGFMELGKDNNVIKFEEKPKTKINSKEWINGGFFFISKKVNKFIKDDNTKFEESPLRALVKINELNAFRHLGFWQPVDTLREKNTLNQLWSENSAPWKNW